MSAPTPLRVAVVGLNFGIHHVRTLSNISDVKIVAVADSRKESADQVAQAYGCRGYSSATELLDHEELDALFVCVSPRRRETVLRPAVERGVALFVEKPWATNREHAAELEAFCSASKGPVMLGFSFRFHPVIVRAKQLIAGECGAVRQGSGSYVFSWLPPVESWLWDPENGGGYFNENSGHLLDVVCHLVGDPVELFAYGRTDDRPSETGAVAALRFATGAIVSLSLGGVGAGANHRFPWLELQTEDGWVRAAGTDHVWHELSWTAGSDGSVHHIDLLPEQLGRTRYSDAFEHFFECVRAGSAPAATVADGVRMVRLADALRESFATARPVLLEGV